MKKETIFIFIYLKALSCVCYACGGSGPHLYACLHCIYFGCKGRHIFDHMEKKEHYVALELNYGIIYCHYCKDYIYSSDCYAVAENHLRREARYILTYYTKLNVMVIYFSHFSHMQNSTEI